MTPRSGESPRTRWIQSNDTRSHRPARSPSRKKLLLFTLLSLVAFVTLAGVFKREITFLKARSGSQGGRAGRKEHGQLDKRSVEQALRRQFDEEASLVFVPGEEWAGSIDGSAAKAAAKEKGQQEHTMEPDDTSVLEEDKVEDDKVEDDKVEDDKERKEGAHEGDDDDYVRDRQVDASEKEGVDLEEYGDADAHEVPEDDYDAYEDDAFVTSKGTPETARAQKEEEASPEVQQALQELRACASLECIGKAHKKLAGKTKFNAPHYFLIGFQKCATTSLNNYLRGHPEYMPSVLKEAHYFTACAKSWNDTNCKANSTQDYIDNYLRISDAVDSGLTAATVDASVDYAWKGEDLAREIYNVFPWLKIVVMMREPISRVISYTRMWTQKGVRTSTHKDNRIACDAGEDLFDCLYPHLTPTAYTGHYAVPLEGWLKVWPADQIHVIQFEEFVSETDAVMRRLKKFLGLDPTLPQNAQLYNVNTRKDSGGSPMKRREYRTLIEMARPDSERVADLLQKHGLAEKGAWMRRWQNVWDENLKRCGPDRVCLINSN
jgi:hypothetical protein